MPGIDDSLTFYPLKIAVLTISDTRDESTDKSGPLLVERLTGHGHQLAGRAIVKDDVELIRAQLKTWIADPEVEVILTTGGTGFAPRDVTPEATMAVIQRPTPGLAEAMRQESLKITPHAMLSRAAAGIRARALIVNLPGSPKGAVENLRFILPVLPHAVELLQESPEAEKGHQAKGI